MEKLSLPRPTKKALSFDMTPKFRTNLGVIFMSKLSKQDKIEIYHLWHDYQIGPAELSQRYRVGKQCYIPYTTYEKEQKRKYRNDPTKPSNWDYNEQDDHYLNYQGVRFSFKNYLTRRDHYGFTRQFKVYEANELQLKSSPNGFG